MNRFRGFFLGNIFPFQWSYLGDNTRVTPMVETSSVKPNSGDLVSAKPPWQLHIWPEGLLVPARTVPASRQQVLVSVFSETYTYLSNGKKWVTGKAAFGPKAQS